MKPEAAWQQAADSLGTGLQQLGIVSSVLQQQQLLLFLRLLQRWSRTVNLTAVTVPQQMVYRHLFDSLPLLPWLAGRRVLDIGSGAGLPGIPLAIMRPEHDFFLLDSRSKRTRFLQQAVMELGLANVVVITARVEQYQPEEEFDTLTARAVAPLSRLLEYSGHLCSAQGRVLALKNWPIDRELKELPGGWQLQHNIVLSVPGVAADRRLLILVRA